MSKMKYDVDKQMYSFLKGKVQLPKFQRGFVWSNDTKKSLIKTIKRGLPMGTLLLSRQGNEKYLIVDGRQRFSTLIEYEKNPSKYIDSDDISLKGLENILKSTKSGSNFLSYMTAEKLNEYLNQIRDTIVKQIKKSINIDELKYNLSEHILEGLHNPSSDDKKNITLATGKYIDDMATMLKIDDIVLPLIIFDGQSSDVIETFINLNQKGTKLSKYDIYSAAWLDDIVMVQDNDIINAVADKYIEAEKTGLDIEGFDVDILRTSFEINIFEYAYAISKIIDSKSQYIFKARDAAQIDSLGFSILAGVFSVNNKDMKDLSKKIIDSKIDLVILKDKIIEVVLEIENEMRRFLMGLDGKQYYLGHTELQLASFIITLFKVKYAITNEGHIISNENSKVNRSKFLRYLHKHYLYDILRGHWSGSGDSRLDELVLLSDIEASRYLSDINKEYFEQVLIQWFDDENNKEKVNVSTEIKIFLNYIARSKIVQKIENIDFDHIIPKKRLSKLKNRDKSIVPISSPANIVIIPSFDNRSKREKTYYELLAEKQSIMTLENNNLDLYSYPTKDELQFVTDHDAFTVQNYKRFLDDRRNYLVKEFLAKMYL